MNLRKLNLGLVALLLGFGLVVTQSAFTTKSSSLTYQYAKTPTGEWIEVDDANFLCIDSDDICKGTFSSPNPLPNQDPDVSVDQDMGSYVPRPR